MICYPHPFYKGQNQDLSLAMGVNTLGRVEVELGGWVVKSYAGAVKKGKAITNCFDLPLTPSQTPCCEQPDRQAGWHNLWDYRGSQQILKTINERVIINFRDKNDVFLFL